MLKQAIRAALASRGYMLSRIENDGWTQRNLSKPGVEPRVVVDVGVFQGTPDLYAAFPDAYWLLVDPLVENEQHMVEVLKKLKGEYVVCAAGAENGSATIQVQASSIGKTSMLDRSTLTKGDETLEEREIPVRRLSMSSSQSAISRAPS